VGFLVHRDGQDYGPFTPEQLQEGLAEGNLLSTDFCRREDQAEWSTVATCTTPAPATKPEPKADSPPAQNQAISNTPLYIGATVILAGLLAGWLLVRNEAKIPDLQPEKTAGQSESNGTKATTFRAKVIPKANTPAKTSPPEKQQPRLFPAHAKHIPADALAVFTIRAGDLLNKAGYEQPIDIPILADHREAITAMSPFASELLRDPESVGLDLTKPMHFYVQHLPPVGKPSAGFAPLLGVVAAVSDSNALEVSLSRLVEARLGGFGRQVMNSLKEENGWWILNTNRLPLAFAFSKKVMVVVIRETPRPGESLAAPLNAAVKSTSGLPATQPDFKRHLDERMDIDLWWNTRRTRQVLATGDDAGMGALLAKLTDSQTLSAGAFFEKGAAAWFIHQQSAEGATAMTGKGLEDPLPALISQRAALAIGLSLDMPAARRWLADLPARFGPQLDLTPKKIDELLNASTGLNYDQWLKLPAGGIAVTLTDVQPGTAGLQPRLLAGFSVANIALADQLLEHLAKSGIKQDLARSNLTLLKSNNGMLCLCTIDQQVAAQLGRVSNPVLGESLALLRGHGVAGWIDARRVRTTAETLGAPKALLDALQPFDRAHFSGTDKAGHMRLDLRFELRDPADNSLRAMLGLAGQLAGLLDTKQAKPAVTHAPTPVSPPIPSPVPTPVGAPIAPPVGAPGGPE
jgi:hypothetical protein